MLSRVPCYKVGPYWLPVLCHSVCVSILMSHFIPPFPAPFLFGDRSVVFPSVIEVQRPCSQRFCLLVSSLCSAVVSVVGVPWTPAELDGV